MTTLASGSTVTIYSVLGKTVAVTLTAPAEVHISGTTTLTNTPILGKRIVSSETITLGAGDRLNLTAFNGAIDYVESAESDTVPTVGTDRQVLTVVDGVATWEDATFDSTYDTDSALETARAASELTFPSFYFTTTDTSVWVATAANVAERVYTNGPEFQGVLTLAQINAISAPEDGDTALASDVGNAPGTMVIYSEDDTKWKALHPIRIKVADRAAGAVQEAEQHPAGWKLALPAGFLGLFSQMEAAAIPRLTPAGGTTVDDWTKLIVKLGTSATLTANTNIGETSGTMIDGVSNDGNNRAPTRWTWDIGATNTSRLIGPMFASGHYAGTNQTTASADPSTVTLGTGTFASALNLSVGCTMTKSGGSLVDTPALTLYWDFIP